LKWDGADISVYTGGPVKHGGQEVLERVNGPLKLTARIFICILDLAIYEVKIDFQCNSVAKVMLEKFVGL
jgi:hypothetical protein